MLRSMIWLLSNAETNKMKEVIRFEADDGSIFLTSEEALRHDKLLAVIAWYRDNKLYGTYGSIDWEDMYEWCTKHKEKLSEFLNIIDAKNQRS